MTGKVEKFQVWVDGRKRDEVVSKQVALDRGAQYAKTAAGVRVVSVLDGKYTRVAAWGDGEKL